ncbi:hypothetical protein SpiGrapes_1255 [Sphaerochaeta pleomorpha str. Grapes]|uniref:Uncharacterized protein n=1 Tax=Sphaerochaeta pleomorpha (strain ATCC BAA-1885 / DSM 22778 / Grapes) TaxID=158190 RepID=G8QTA2_SPHPG|nr:hypothetical protein [Sphaerochaeta pleomorpha]AEV29069.1 hypothetical protein SpiGrapes_1255 [Sphaerochaeta pleomorpha str. Grapes]
MGKIVYLVFTGVSGSFLQHYGYGATARGNEKSNRQMVWYIHSSARLIRRGKQSKAGPFLPIFAESRVNTIVRNPRAIY